MEEKRDGDFVLLMLYITLIYGNRSVKNNGFVIIMVSTYSIAGFDSFTECTEFIN